MRFQGSVLGLLVAGALSCDGSGVESAKALTLERVRGTWVAAAIDGEPLNDGEIRVHLGTTAELRSNGPCHEAEGQWELTQRGVVIRDVTTTFDDECAEPMRTITRRFASAATDLTSAGLIGGELHLTDGSGATRIRLRRVERDS